MQIFGLEISRIKKQERKEEEMFVKIVNQLSDTIDEMIKEINITDISRISNSLLESMIKNINKLNKLSDLYSANICSSSCICFLIDTGIEDASGLLKELIIAIRKYLKSKLVFSDYIETFYAENGEDVSKDELNNDEVFLENKNELDKALYNALNVIYKYDRILNSIKETIESETLKTNLNYDFIKNRVHNKSCFTTRAEHNREYFEYNIKFASNLDSKEIAEQKI